MDISLRELGVVGVALGMQSTFMVLYFRQNTRLTTAIDKLSASIVAKDKNDIIQAQKLDGALHKIEENYIKILDEVKSIHYRINDVSEKIVAIDTRTQMCPKIAAQEGKDV